jgi:erythromycin esterase
MPLAPVRHPLRLLGFALAALLLAGCGGEGGGPPTQPPPVVEPPVPPPPDDPDHLLTDAQLATPEDPFAPAENAAWVQWATANHHPVRSLTSRRHDDLQFLKTAIGSRRIVQLGESGHGVKEFNLAKVRLIRFLHQEMGFDVIAFESGLYECDRAGRQTSLSAQQLMTSCIFGVWNTHEVLALFEYIKQTQNTARPLILTGVDVQISDTPMNLGAAAFFRDVVAKVDPAYARRVFTLDSLFIAEYQRVSQNAINAQARVLAFQTLEEREHLIARYDSLHVFLTANQAALAGAVPGDPAAGILARQTAYSRKRFMMELTAPLGSHAFQLARDGGMADNLDFILGELHPGKKVMVWAHNYHIQHDRPAVRTSFNSVEPRTMGAWVAERHRPELYTVGLFMHRGQAAWNDRVVYAIRTATAGSLESILYRVRRKHLFVDLLGQTNGPGREWIFQETAAKEWGFTPEWQVLRNQYDGILFVDTVSPPQYL